MSIRFQSRVSPRLGGSPYRLAFPELSLYGVNLADGLGFRRLGRSEYTHGYGRRVGGKGRRLSVERQPVGRMAVADARRDHNYIMYCAITKATTTRMIRMINRLSMRRLQRGASD